MNYITGKFTANIIFLILFFFSQYSLKAHEPDQVDHMNRLSVSGEGDVSLRYTVSHGEVLGFVERQKMDTNGNGILSDDEQNIYMSEKKSSLVEGLLLEVDGERLVWNITDYRIGLVPERVIAKQFWYIIEFKSRIANPGSHRVYFYDSNHEGITGLIDIALEQGTFTVSGVESVEEDKILRGVEFSLDFTETAPSQNFAFSLRTESDQENAARAQVEEESSRLTAILEEENIAFKFLILAFAMAFGLGCVHALSPGHGKTIVAAYLVGSKGRIRDAIFLGSVVTMTHVSSVLALGVLTLFASQYILPQEIYPWLGFGSGILIVIIGYFMYRQRSNASHGHSHSHGLFGHSHSHSHDHEPHEHNHNHSKDEIHGDHEVGAHHHHDKKESGVSLWSLLGLGISGGAVPCPSALVVLLTAISYQKLMLGLLLIIVFSLGLASVLIAIGILTVVAGSFIKRFSGDKEQTLFRILSIGSSIVIMLVGAGIAIKGLLDAGVLQINI